MSVIERIKGDETPMEFTMDFTAINKTLADITEIYCSIKESRTDADDSLFLKTMTGTDITANLISGNIYQILVSWDAADYTAFTLNKIYEIGLFAKFTGETTSNENVDTIHKIKIIQDFMRA